MHHLKINSCHVFQDQDILLSRSIHQCCILYYRNTLDSIASSILAFLFLHNPFFIFSLDFLSLFSSFLIYSSLPPCLISLLQVLLTIIDLDLGSPFEEEQEEGDGAIFSSTSRSSSFPSKFNKCFLKNRTPTTLNSIPSLPIRSFRSSSISSSSSLPQSYPRILSVNVDDEDLETKDEEESEENNHDETSPLTISDHINLFLNPGSKNDEKIITLCGSIDENDYLIGQSFLSYNSNVVIELVTRNHEFRVHEKRRRGFKFDYQFVQMQVSPKSEGNEELDHKESEYKKSDHKESEENDLMSITSVFQVKIGTVGHITSLNFPHTTPKGVKHKIIVRGEIGSNIELQVTKSMVATNLLRNGSCDSNSGEVAILTIKDYFGNINFYPPIPSVWSLCLRNNSDGSVHRGSGSDKRNRRLIRRYFHGINRIKSIQSNFHVISIESSTTKATFSQPFLFFFRSIRGLFSLSFFCIFS